MDEDEEDSAAVLTGSVLAITGLMSGLAAGVGASPPPMLLAGVDTCSSFTERGSSLTGPNDGSPFSPGPSSLFSPLPMERRSGLQSTSILLPSFIDLGPPELLSKFSMDFLPCAGVVAAEPSGVDRVSERSGSGPLEDSSGSSVARIWSGSCWDGGGSGAGTGAPNGVGGCEPPKLEGTDEARGGCWLGGPCGCGVEAWPRMDDCCIRPAVLPGGVCWGASCCCCGCCCGCWGCCRCP